MDTSLCLPFNPANAVSEQKSCVFVGQEEIKITYGGHNGHCIAKVGDAMKHGNGNMTSSLQLHNVLDCSMKKISNIAC